ncbi:MAG: hypothetical protein V1668_02830 [Patescibacteria group bacterium]
MKKHLLFFVILAVIMMATQGCSVGRFIKTAYESPDSNSDSYTAYISLNGTTLLGCPDPYSNVQVTSLKIAGTSASVSTMQPDGMLPTAYRWSNGKSGSTTWFTNVQRAKTTPIELQYSVQITFRYYANVQLKDGTYREQPVGKPIVKTFFFGIEHVNGKF